MIDLENLLIYKEYVEMICFTVDNLMKYDEKIEIKDDIKKITYDGLNFLISAHKEKNINQKLILLEQLDNSLKTLKVLVKISYKKKYINNRIMKSWNKKLINISNFTWSWIKSCENKENIFV